MANVIPELASREPAGRLAGVAKSAGLEEEERVGDAGGRSGLALWQRSAGGSGRCSCGGTCAGCRRRAGGGGVGRTPRSGALSAVREVVAEGGHALDPQLQREFQPRFGRDLGAVRVHTDPRAAESARSIHARAYTYGSHIAFGTGQYSPHSTDGRRLLAHELTHVVQQSAAPAHRPASVSEPGGASEREAHGVAQRVARGGSAIGAVAQTAAPGVVQRDLATEPPANVADQPDLTAAQIRQALAFNRSRYTAEHTRVIQDIVGTEPTGTWTEADILAIAQIQEEYNLTSDGMVGNEMFRFLNTEMGAEGVAADDENCLVSFFVLGFPVSFTNSGGGQHNLRGHFRGQAQFQARCNCADYEYRQFIRGRFTRTRGGVVNDLGGIFNLLPAGRLTADFREDGDTSDNPVNYGHRANPADNNPEDRYINDAGNDDQANGCRYRNEDFPGANLNTQAGDSFDALMQFRGVIRRSGREVRSLEWTAIRGVFNVP